MDLIDDDEGGHPEEEAVEDGVEVDEDDRPSSQLQNLAPVDHDFCGDIDDDDVDDEGVDDMTLVLGSYQNNLCSSMRTTISKEKPHTGAKTPAYALIAQTV